jgi:hypothetical protein
MQGRYWVTSRSSLIATLRLVRLEIEIIGDIAHMIEMGIEDKKKGPALNERTARSVKVVAGAGFAQERTKWTLMRFA